MTTFGFFPCAVLVWQFASIKTPRASHNRLLRDLMTATPVSRVDGRLVLVLALVQVRQLDRVQEVLDLLLGERLLLADDLEDALAALVRLVRELGRLVVAEHRVQR